jgi:hypothetical protein
MSKVARLQRDRRGGGISEIFNGLLNRLGLSEEEERSKKRKQSFN